MCGKPKVNGENQGSCNGCCDIVSTYNIEVTKIINEINVIDDPPKKSPKLKSL